MNIQPHILVSNDDGIDSPGLHRLAAALRAVGRVSIVAPDRNWSISGHHKTLRQFLRADPYPLDIEGIEAVYACSGSPADCVTLGCEGLLASPPDLVVSGINRGPNLGQDVTYSGTVAAAFDPDHLGGHTHPGMPRPEDFVTQKLEVHIEVDVLVVELADDVFLHDRAHLAQVHHEARFRARLTFYGDPELVIVPVPVRIGALAEGGLILLCTPLRSS